MRYRFTMKAFLVGFVVLGIVITGLLQLARRHDVESRRVGTLDGLKSTNVSRGGAETRETHDILIKAVEGATYSSLKTPRLLTARLTAEHPQVRDGYFIAVHWVCHTPVADGIEVTFSNGTTERARFTDATLAENDASGRVLFYGVVSGNELPSLSKDLDPSDIRSIALLSGDDVCSDSLSPQKQ